MKLRQNERCLLHGRYDCCGREVVAKRIQRHPWNNGTRRIDDSTVPRGYREIRSKAAMRELLKRKIAEQNNRCGICKQLFLDAREIVPDHINPRGMGGGRRDDHPDNIQAAHSDCNMDKGSKRL